MHSIPKTYRLLRNVLVFPPSIKSLKMLMWNIAVYPGFNKNILDVLQKKMANSPPRHKVVALMVDEMSIKEGISYSSGRDVIKAFIEGVETMWRVVAKNAMRMKLSLVSATNLCGCAVIGKAVTGPRKRAVVVAAPRRDTGSCVFYWPPKMTSN